MHIGGLQKLTLVDYPGKVAATVFLIGCNFKCPFCQNPELVNLEEIKKQPQISEKEFFEFLDSKKDLIDGICITGGEPTIHPDLIDFIQNIKEKGFLIKLDTNGSMPEVLSKLVNEHLLDFIAMDIKTSASKYEKIYPVKSRNAGAAKQLFNRVKKSVEIIKNSGIDYEFRTTTVPGLVKKEDIEEIGKWLKGVKKFALQQFQNKKVLDKKFEKIQPYSEEILKNFQKILEKYINEVELRL
ncbi:MAG: anaerobic ribonucleoside-triphosphate reductase activating protein [Candidatus Portnoybacteria bacterium RIFCSPHIGHO2_01_FULL_39_19]|nr:MAG: anaerobic ribonucleoside-triphosphate reductase activating protein [Candidatus Portnoybacteria bacterium RIFCSPHIGHO2_01_FULL_39_19]